MGMLSGHGGLARGRASVIKSLKTHDGDHGGAGYQGEGTVDELAAGKGGSLGSTKGAGLDERASFGPGRRPPPELALGLLSSSAPSSAPSPSGDMCPGRVDQRHSGSLPPSRVTPITSVLSFPDAHGHPGGRWARLLWLLWTHAGTSFLASGLAAATFCPGRVDQRHSLLTSSATPTTVRPPSPTRSPLVGRSIGSYYVSGLGDDVGWDDAT
ncbi:hypothetical protein THAOC_20696 [Thalassiosira oceanica]|uniref:Uncharacterized protein n=1 Tax=Thalassiosira oceanica TaxID=159749 RepID=K0S2S7_THAOC|nr:hypothetical protein THAOC_20696 [Thalassiosira oceanica]|eukprot:EJK59119.1 hypothetical protein THAOC_20696 [Thalassiosira oceanica]